MARLTIPDEPTFATFTTSAQTVFPISFSLFAKENLSVSIDGVELLKSGFTFSGALLDGGGYAGGTVTLNQPATGRVVIWRALTPERTSNFAPANNTPVGSVDQSLNRLTALIQDTDRDVGRAIRAPLGEEGLELPPRASRVGRRQVLGTDQTGAMTLLSGSDFKGDPGANVMAIGPWVSLPSMSIPEGTDIIQTSSYHAGNGWGQATYRAIPDAGQAATPYRQRDRAGRLFEIVVDKGVSIDQFGAVPGADALDGFLSAIEAVSVLRGGGYIYAPWTGLGGWKVRDSVLVRQSNITIGLRDDVALSKTTSGSTFFFDGGIPGAPLENVRLIGEGARHKVDGNGRNMTDYPDYIEGGMPWASAVIFRNCRSFRCENIHGYNGYVNSIRVTHSRFGTVIDCAGSHAYYDNGISIDHDPYGTVWSPLDPETWACIDITDCRAWLNESLGITSYDATGNTFSECLAYNNGNDLTSRPHRGGGFSAESNGFDTVAVRKRNHRTRFINCRSIGNWNQGLHVTAVGTEWRGGEILGTRAPVVRPDPNGFYGHNVVIFGVGALYFDGLNASAARRAFSMVATQSGSDYFHPSLRFSGGISDTGRGGIYGRGVASVEIASGATFRNIGADAAAWSGVQIDNSGAAYNPSGGSLVIDGAPLEEVQGLAVDVQEIGDADIKNVDLKNIRKGVTPGIPIRVLKANRSSIQNIRNRDTNAKTTSIVQHGAAVSSGLVKNIAGDSTTPNVLIADAAAAQTGATREIRSLFRLVNFPPANVPGGPSAAGFNTRTFTNISENVYSWPVGGSGPYTSVTVPAGTYEIEAYASTYKSGDHVLYLMDSAGNAIGASIRATGSAASDSEAMSSMPRRRFTFATATELRLRSWTELSRAVDGLGKAFTMQGINACLQIWGE